MTVYIAGPISGHPHGNLFAFLSARDYLSKRNCRCILPHDVVAPIVATDHARRCPAYTWCACMVSLLPIVEAVEAVALLPGHEQSVGARRELQTAIERGAVLIELDEESLWA